MITVVVLVTNDRKIMKLFGSRSDDMPAGRRKLPGRNTPKKRNARDGSGGSRDTGPDCLSIANGAQAAHVTGTSNVYRMDRSVFQVLQERFPACRDYRCGKTGLFFVCHLHQERPGCGARTDGETAFRHDLV